MSVLSYIGVIVYGDNEWTYRLCIVCLYMYCRWRSKHPEGIIGIPLAGLISQHICGNPTPGPEFLMSYVVVFSIFDELRSEVKCFLCWYWWNCWPSMFQLSFHNCIRYNICLKVTTLLLHTLNPTLPTREIPQCYVIVLICHSSYKQHVVCMGHQYYDRFVYPGIQWLV